MLGCKVCHRMTLFLLFHSAHCGVTTVTLDHNYSINATKSNLHNSCNRMQVKRLNATNANHATCSFVVNIRTCNLPSFIILSLIEYYCLQKNYKELSFFCVVSNILLPALPNPFELFACYGMLMLSMPVLRSSEHD